MRGLNSKTVELFNSSAASNYPIIAVTETWLDVNIHSFELFDSYKYTVNRCDRNFIDTNLSRGGGVLLAVDSSLSATEFVSEI